MDVRLSPEQVALRESAAQVVDRLGPATVAQLDDAERAGKLDAAVLAAGWRDLHRRGLADAAFLGPTLAADLRRRVGAPATTAIATIVLSSDLSRLAEADDAHATAVDAQGASSALLLLPGERGRRLGVVPLGVATTSADLTRVARRQESQQATALEGQTRPLEADDMARWQSLGLAVACADLVGTMRGALGLATEYAKERKQYGAAIGSFQAVQHMLADAHVATEGARSIALHAAWAVDALDAHDALAAGAVAKAYCSRAALEVCEAVIQVHGGIGNTWDCLAHVYLRRVLAATDLFPVALEEITRGLS